MATGAAALVDKLDHALPDVRHRALRTIQFKLLAGLWSADDLVHETFFIDALIASIRNEEPLATSILDQLVKDENARERLKGDVAKFMGLPGCKDAVRRILTESRSRDPPGFTKGNHDPPEQDAFLQNNDYEDLDRLLSSQAEDLYQAHAQDGSEVDFAAARRAFC